MTCRGAAGARHGAVTRGPRATPAPNAAAESPGSHPRTPNQAHRTGRRAHADTSPQASAAPDASPGATAPTSAAHSPSRPPRSPTSAANTPADAAPRPSRGPDRCRRCCQGSLGLFSLCCSLQRPSRRSGWVAQHTGDLPPSLRIHYLGTLQIPWGLSLPPRVRLLRPGNRCLRGGPPMPAIAHMICHSCGAHSEGLASRNGSSATSCRCGGTRQVVRIARHPWGAASASPAELERSFQDRADDETLTPVPKAQ